MKTAFATSACLAGSLLVPTVASADFINVTVNVVDLGAPGGTTYRFYANFDTPTDQLIAVSGNDEFQPFKMQTNTVLMNDGGVGDGMAAEDFPFFGAPWDSWLAMGSDEFSTEVAYSPGWNGGDGENAAVVGSALSQADNGGWYDTNPATPLTGGTVLIAQFTVEDQEYGPGTAAMRGTIDYLVSHGDLVCVPFHVGDASNDGRVDLVDLIVTIISAGPCESCRADLNGDGVVNVSDVILLFLVAPCDPGDCALDIDGSGRVDLIDLIWFLTLLGSI